MFNRKTESKETLAFQISGSEAVYQALSDISQAYPDTILTPLHLLQYLTKKRRLVGGLLVSEATNLPPLKRQDSIEPVATIKISGQTIKCTQDLADLLNQAQESAGQGNVIKTEHLIIGESHLPDSVVLSSLKPTIGKEFHTPRYISEVAKEIKKVTSLIESGSRAIEIKSAPNQQLQTINLIEAAQKGFITEHAAKDEWIKNALISLENSNIVALTSNNSEEALSVIEGLALALAKDKSSSFNYKGIICINPVSLEQNSDLVIKSALELAKGGILYLPDLDLYLSNSRLKSAIASGDLKIITTTPQIPESEYKKIDRVLRTATILNLSPMSATETEKIINRSLKSLESDLSNGQKIIVSAEAVKEASYLANRYQTVLGLPTIQGAKLLIRHATGLLKLEMSQMDQFKGKSMKVDLKIDLEDIDYALKDLKGIDPKPEDVEKYKYTAQELAKKIVGQDETLKDIASTLLRAKTGFGNPKRPIGSFLFLGPSGVGKSETAKVLAEFMFGSPDDLIVLNMSEFSEEHTVSALLGSPVGYKGSESGGRLTEAVAKKPYAVLVLDEIEKADPAVLLALLRLLEEGTIQDRSGKLVDCRNLVIIATTNLLSSDEAVIRLRPEFVNRFDKVEVFNTLSVQNLEKIVDIQLVPTKKNLLERGVQLTISDAARKYLAEKGFDPKFGARPLRRLIEEKVVNSLAQLQASKELKSGMNILIDLKDNEIVLTK